MLSVLLLPGGGGEDDIDIGGGVLVLGGVLGPGHGGVVVVRGGSAGHLWLLSQHVINISFTLCCVKIWIVKSRININIILLNIHFSE